MTQNNRNNKNNKKPKQNYVLMFIIFAVLAILVVRFGSTQEGGVLDRLGGGVSKNIDYYELKQLIKNNEVTSVSIGQTIIKAVGNGVGGQKIYYTAKKVQDSTLVPLLDEKNIN